MIPMTQHRTFLDITASATGQPWAERLDAFPLKTPHI
jgi:hypothetical protein